MKIQKLFMLLLLVCGARVGDAQDQTQNSGPDEQPKTLEENSFSGSKALESLLIIEGMDSRGTGFLTEINGKVFAVTNLHVMAGYGSAESPTASIKTVKNERLNIERVFGAKGHDIALIQFTESDAYSHRALEYTGSIQEFVKTDDEVKIPGNSKGRGVFLWTPGKVRGIGPDKIEHDAPTFAGNSGSPVIHLMSNSVIGVDTETTADPIMNPFDKDAREHKDSAIKDDFRYFAYRLDTPNSWYQIDLKEFQQQARRLEKWEIERLLAIGFVQSFLDKEPDYTWWEDGRLKRIADRFVEDAQKISSSRERFVGTDGIYDYYDIYRVIHPSERARLKRRVIGELHNYIASAKKKDLLKRDKIYPFLQADYRKAIERSEWLTNYLKENRKFLSE